jgi:hypothetical protein
MAGGNGSIIFSGGTGLGDRCHGTLRDWKCTEIVPRDRLIIQKSNAVSRNLLI